jgi:ribonuclease HI
LRHYFQAHRVVVVTSYPLKAILHNSNATGNIAKWAVELAKFQLEFQARHAVKSQVLADIIMEWTPPPSAPGGPDPDSDPKPAEPKALVFTEPHWTLFFDGSARQQPGGAGVVLIDPSGDQVKYMVHLEFKATNNMAEYEALIFDLLAALSLGIHQLLVKGDSQLIIKKVRGECSCNEPRLVAYLLHVRKLEKDFTALELQHVPRAHNSAIDELSTRASIWAPVPEGVFERRLLRPTAQPTKLGEGGETSTSKLAVPVVFHPQDPPRLVCATAGPANLVAPQPMSQSGPDAWISEIWDYLKENILPEDHVAAERIVRLAKRYTVVEGDLYRRDVNGILMRCITQEEGHELLTEIHGGECGSHSASRTLVGKAFRHGFYWPTALQDAAEMVKSCEACQFHAKQIHTGSDSANDSTLLAIHRMGGEYPGTIPQGRRWVPFPLRRQRLPLWSTSPRVLLLPSSSRLFADLGSQTISLRTTGPSSEVGSSKSIARASALSFALRLWLIPGATAKLRGQTQKSSGDSRHAPMSA